MPRTARKKSKSGIYHVMLRGINKQEIFHDDYDRLRFLETLARYKEQSNAKVHGWCLMGNHVHLLLQEGAEELSNTMKRIGVSYVRYYNWKYDHIGHLFQDRYLSEEIEKDQYLLTVIRYIHQNPVKAAMVKGPGHYRWSSCGRYYGKEEVPEGLTDTALILGMFSNDEANATERFRRFNEQENQDICLDEPKQKRISDDQAATAIKRLINGMDFVEFHNVPKTKRDEFIKQIKEIEGISLRQAARILGVSNNLIFKA